jgi:hypothetical protein
MQLLSLLLLLSTHRIMFKNIKINNLRNIFFYVVQNNIKNVT